MTEIKNEIRKYWYILKLVKKKKDWAGYILGLICLPLFIVIALGVKLWEQ